MDHFSVIAAPSSSNFAFRASASSMETPSLIIFGAASTNSFASLSPSPVISRMALMTFTFCEPKFVSSTSNSVFFLGGFGSFGTICVMAAETPNSFSHALVDLRNHQFFHVYRLLSDHGNTKEKQIQKAACLFGQAAFLALITADCLVIPRFAQRLPAPGICLIRS